MLPEIGIVRMHRRSCGISTIPYVPNTPTWQYSVVQTMPPGKILTAMLHIILDRHILIYAMSAYMYTPSEYLPTPQFPSSKINNYKNTTIHKLPEGIEYNTMLEFNNDKEVIHLLINLKYIVIVVETGFLS